MRHGGPLLRALGFLQSRLYHKQIISELCNLPISTFNIESVFMVPAPGVRGLAFTTEAISTPKTLQTCPSLLDCPSLMSWSQWEVQDVLWSRVLTHFDQWISMTLNQISMTKLKTRYKHENCRKCCVLRAFAGLYFERLSLKNILILSNSAKMRCDFNKFP